MSTPNLARISAGRRVIDRAAGGKEIALFQDAQDAIDYVQMIETRDRLRDGIKALIAQSAGWSVSVDALRTLLDGEAMG